MFAFAHSNKSALSKAALVPIFLVKASSLLYTIPNHIRCHYTMKQLSDIFPSWVAFLVFVSISYFHTL